MICNHENEIAVWSTSEWMSIGYDFGWVVHRIYEVPVKEEHLMGNKSAREDFRHGAYCPDCGRNHAKITQEIDGMLKDEDEERIKAEKEYNNYVRG